MVLQLVNGTIGVSVVLLPRSHLMGALRHLIELTISCQGCGLQRQRRVLCTVQFLHPDIIVGAGGTAWISVEAAVGDRRRVVLVLLLVV